MKTEFKTKFLQHLIKKKEDEGTTLIECLIVIIIIGILSAIALPSFLNQANKAKEVEAKIYAGAANRSQQVFYLERNRFASDFARLGLGISTATTNYTYELTFAGSVDTNAYFLGHPENTNTLRAFVGAAQIGLTAGQAATLTVLAQSVFPGTADTTAVTINTAGQPEVNAPDWEDVAG